MVLQLWRQLADRWWRLNYRGEYLQWPSWHPTQVQWKRVDWSLWRLSFQSIAICSKSAPFWKFGRTIPRFISPPQEQPRWHQGACEATPFWWSSNRAYQRSTCKGFLEGFEERGAVEVVRGGNRLYLLGAGICTDLPCGSFSRSVKNHGQELWIICVLEIWFGVMRSVVKVIRLRSFLIGFT